MINTLKHRRAARNRHIHGGDTGLVASADRCAAQRHPVRMPRRLSGALRQRSAGRRGLAAMPAEEHVEPLAGLPGRGARGRARGGAQGGVGAGSSAQGRADAGSRAQERCRTRTAAPAATAAAAAKPATAAPAAAPKAQRPARGQASRPMRRWPRSAAPAAPTIRRSAPACRPAALRRCNAWRRTRRRCRRPASRPSTRPVAVPRPQRRRRGDREPGSGRCSARTGIVLRPMRPREELFVLRSACSGDVRTLCGGVAPGGGRIMQCLATQAGSISPACKEVLAQFAANEPECAACAGGTAGIAQAERVYIRRETRGSTLDQPDRQRDVQQRHHDLVRHMPVPQPCQLVEAVEKFSTRRMTPNSSTPRPTRP